MAKRSKEEREEERKKELLRTLRRGPDLDRFIDEKNTAKGICKCMDIRARIFLR